MDYNTKQTADQTINDILANKKEPLLSVFFTAGFPKLNDTSLILENLEKAE